VLAEEVKPLLERFLAKRGLRLSPEKTLSTPIEEGFDCLGQNVRTYHGKLLIKPSHKRVKALLQKVREVIKGNKSITAGHVIGRLHPLLRGWANSHRHVGSKATFAKMEQAILQALWRWAKRLSVTGL